MTDTKAGWWFSADRKWHEGDPPRGWWQSRTGRWHPPPAEEAGGLADTAEISEEELAAGAPRHMAPGLSATEENHLWEPDGDASPTRQPTWFKLGVPVTLTALMVIVAAIGFLAWGPSVSVEDPNGGQPGSGEDGRREGVRITSSSGKSPGAEAPPPGATDEPGSESNPSEQGADGSSPSGGDTSPPSESPDVNHSKADFEPPGTDSEDDGDTSAGSGSPEDCPDWTPPGRPDHPTAPDRGNREDCE